MSYQCQLCGHDGPLSEPCPRCEPRAVRVSLELRNEDPTETPSIHEGIEGTWLVLVADGQELAAVNPYEGEPQKGTAQAIADAGPIIAALLHRLAATRQALTDVVKVVDEALVRQVRATDLLKKSRILDDEYSSDADSEIANALEYVLGEVDADHCGVLNRYRDVAAN